MDANIQKNYATLISNKVELILNEIENTHGTLGWLDLFYIWKETKKIMKINMEERRKRWFFLK